MFSLLCVLVWVVAQPTINANNAMALIVLNEIRICFMFLVYPGFAVGKMENFPVFRGRCT